MRIACLLALALTATAHAQLVSTDAELRGAIANARPGDHIRIVPGTYAGGMHFTDVRGKPDRAITIEGTDPDDRPVIRGGSQGLHLADPAYVKLRYIVVEDADDNGINIDDGGDMDQSAHHMILEHITVRNVGPNGNRDGIKLSGVREFVVRDGLIQRWGDGGSGIDMVGCRNGVIERCTLAHVLDTAASSGIQAKGGTQNVVIRKCHFSRAGRRAINLGGSTGDRFFRPPLKAVANTESRQVMVRHCTFVGSNTPVAFTTSVDCRVERCTIYRPGRWVLRILQEKPLDRFLPSQRGRFSDNVIVWQAGDLHRFVNVGPDTKPETFVFEGNWWYCADRPGASRPRLPGGETDGVYGRDPGLELRDGVPVPADGGPAQAAGVGANRPSTSR